MRLLPNSGETRFHEDSRSKFRDSVPFWRAIAHKQSCSPTYRKRFPAEYAHGFFSRREKSRLSPQFFYVRPKNRTGEYHRYGDAFPIDGSDQVPSTAGARSYGGVRIWSLGRKLAKRGYSC